MSGFGAYELDMPLGATVPLSGGRAASGGGGRQFWLQTKSVWHLKAVLVGDPVFNQMSQVHREAMFTAWNGGGAAILTGQNFYTSLLKCCHEAPVPQMGEKQTDNFLGCPFPRETPVPSSLTQPRPRPTQSPDPGPGGLTLPSPRRTSASRFDSRDPGGFDSLWTTHCGVRVQERPPALFRTYKIRSSLVFAGLPWQLRNKQDWTSLNPRQ